MVVKRLFISFLLCAVLLIPVSDSANHEVVMQQTGQGTSVPPAEQSLSFEATPLTAREEVALADSPFMRIVETSSDAQLAQAGITRQDIPLVKYHVHQLVLAREHVTYGGEIVFRRYPLTINEDLLSLPNRTIVLPPFDKNALGETLYAFIPAIREGILQGIGDFTVRTGISFHVSDRRPEHSAVVPISFVEALAQVGNGAFLNTDTSSGVLGRVVGRVSDPIYVPELDLHYRQMSNARIELSVSELQDAANVLRLLQFSLSAQTAFMQERVRKIVCHELFHTIGIYHSRRLDDLMYPGYRPMVLKGMAVTSPATAGTKVVIQMNGMIARYTIPRHAVIVKGADGRVEVMESGDGDQSDDPSNLVARALALIASRINAF